MLSISNVIKGIPYSFVKKYGRQILLVKKHMPEIELGLSMVSSAAAIITASKATLHASEVIKKHAEDMEEIKKAESYKDEDYTPELILEDKKNVMIHTAVDLTKLYLPTIVLYGASCALMVHSHKEMKRRYDQAVMAFNAISAAFNSYRQNVIESEGEEKDLEYLHGKKKEIEDKDEDNIYDDVEVEDDKNPYCFTFEQYRPDGHINPNWVNHYETCYAYLCGMQSMMNHRLQSVGHVFLNEVLDVLKLPHTQAGALVGWVRDSKKGDGYILFGFDKPGAIDYDNISFNLEFNVQGVIFDMI